MITPNVGLSVNRQCTLLGIARSSFYDQPGPTSADELDLLNRLDRIFTEHPVYGSRRLQVALLREGVSVGRRRIRRLMRKLAVHIASRPKPAPWPGGWVLLTGKCWLVSSAPIVSREWGMARTRTEMRRIREVLRLRFELHFSDTQVAHGAGIARSTVQDYLQTEQSDRPELRAAGSSGR